MHFFTPMNRWLIMKFLQYWLTYDLFFYDFYWILQQYGTKEKKITATQAVIIV